MRKRSLLVVLLLALTFAAPARAEGMNNFYAGLNGMLTAPADPVMHVISPPEAFEELPFHPVTGRIVGVGSGTLMGFYRAAIGATDLAFTPFWVFPTLSPEARWNLFGYEIEYE